MVIEESLSMKEGNPFFLFIDLIKLDQAVHTLVVKRDKLNDDLRLAQHAFDEKKEKLEAARARYFALKRDMDSKESEISSLRDKERVKRASLEHVSNPREYMAACAQLDDITKKIDHIEDELLKLVSIYEQAESEYDECKNKFEHDQINFSLLVHEKNSDIVLLDQEAQSLMSQRVTYEARVPLEWREKYDAMKLKVENPVVPLDLDNNSCSGCFYKVPLNDVAAIKRHKLIQCKDCFRFLYTL
ncbi:MAG: hypothetical protein WC707_03125 [Candidatus Babeliaceae bacterium]|jgi:predicted  nucleic acid-binding Zn-ribbon protein